MNVEIYGTHGLLIKPVNIGIETAYPKLILNLYAQALCRIDYILKCLLKHETSLHTQITMSYFEKHLMRRKCPYT